MTLKDTSGISNPAFESDQTVADPVKQTPEVVGKPVYSPEEIKKEKFLIWKNLIIISIGFMFLFTSYNSMANLQSSVNPSVGTAALSTLYAALVVSCCFLPSWLIRKLRVKYTMAVCMLGYSTYIAAQFYPEYYTLVPTAIILGLGAAPMWSAKCTYLTKAGTRYAEITGQDAEVVITRFFGVFFLFFQSTQVWGNLISSTVLSVDVKEMNKTWEEYEQCGFNFCPEPPSASSDDDEGVPDWQLYTMASIYLVFALLSSLIIVVFVTPLRKFVGKDAEISSGNADKTGAQLLVATFHHMRNPYQLLIIPLTIWSGLEQAFLSADFTAAYVTCGIGVHNVGYAMICYGICDAIFSASFSHVVRFMGRVPVFTAGFLLNLGIIITCMVWTPRPEDMALFFVIPALWGVSDAVWQTQINAFYGVIFPGQSEAAFSNYRLWESLGFIIAYVCSTLICISDKVVILLVFLALGSLGYYTIEFLEWKGGLKKDNEGKVVPIDKLICSKVE